VEPSAVKFDVEVPEEVLLKGWRPVLAYLRELRAQGGAPVQEARVFLLGEGGQGKTSLLRALLDSERDCTDPIDVDDRTVGIDVQVRSMHMY
jgi:GTPase SAR1 family protein